RGGGLGGLAGELGLLGVPIFLFHEGRDRTAAAAFKQMANLSHGAYLSFDLASADRLKELLGAVAVYAAGGYRALTAYGQGKGSEVLRLTSQLREGGAAMLYLLGGFAVLSGFLMLGFLVIHADPARLARGLKVTGVVIAVAAVATLAVSGRLAALLMPLAMLMPLLIRVRSILDRYRPPSGGQTSTVATAFLRMTLDHDTGTMEGTILRGRFAGMRL